MGLGAAVVDVGGVVVVEVDSMVLTAVVVNRPSGSSLLPQPLIDAVSRAPTVNIMGVRLRTISMGSSWQIRTDDADISGDRELMILR